MDEPQRYFLKRQAAVFAEMAAAHLPWVLDAMEPQNRRSCEARRQTMTAGRAIGISDRDLAGFFRLDRSSVWRALADGPAALNIAPCESLRTRLVAPVAKTKSAMQRARWPVRKQKAA